MRTTLFRRENNQGAVDDLTRQDKRNIKPFVFHIFSLSIDEITRYSRNWFPSWKCWKYQTLKQGEDHTFPLSAFVLHRNARSILWGQFIFGKTFLLSKNPWDQGIPTFYLEFFSNLGNSCANLNFGGYCSRLWKKDAIFEDIAKATVMEVFWYVLWNMSYVAWWQVGKYLVPVKPKNSWTVPSSRRTRADCIW